MYLSDFSTAEAFGSTSARPCVSADRAGREDFRRVWRALTLESTLKRSPVKRGATVNFAA